MEVFKKLNTIFNKVQHDLQQSVQSGKQTIEDNVINKMKKLSLSSIKNEFDSIIPAVGVDTSALDHASLDAGADLVNKFERDWVEAHTTLLDNIAKAKTTDELLLSIVAICQTRYDGIKNFQKQMATLSVIGIGLDSIRDSAVRLGDQFAGIETALDDLEGLCDAIDAQKEIIAHIQQLEDKERKAEEQKVKNELALLSEKRQVYSEQASLDLQTYKQVGATPSMVESKFKPVVSSTTISEITIADLVDAENAKLQDFYADDESENESSAGHPSSSAGLPETPATQSHAATKGDSAERDALTEDSTASDSEILEDSRPEPAAPEKAKTKKAKRPAVAPIVESPTPIVIPSPVASTGSSLDALGMPVQPQEDFLAAASSSVESAAAPPPDTDAALDAVLDAVATAAAAAAADEHEEDETPDAAAGSSSAAAQASGKKKKSGGGKKKKGSSK